jgi:hypothetical protein
VPSLVSNNNTEFSRDNISQLEKNFNNKMLWYKTIDELPFNATSDFENLLNGLIKNVLGYKATGFLKSWKELMKNDIETYFTDARKYQETKPSFLLKEQLNKAFSTNILPSKYELSEYNIPVLINDRKTLLKLNTIAMAAYIDTPMLLGLENTDMDYWNDLNKILGRKENGSFSNSFDHSINEIIKTEIIKGDAYLEKDPVTGLKYYIYEREDGSKFNLLEVATGIKSFGILQMLLKKDVLNSNTLLIMDEPEVHLHPQWIIEFARLIVLLNKHIGVKFFIASHNPDMVAAIKYIGEKEKIDNNINFYLAQKQENSFTYSYLHTGTDIEALFESFNLSIERMNQYSDIKETDE